MQITLIGFGTTSQVHRSKSGRHDSRNWNLNLFSLFYPDTAKNPWPATPKKGIPSIRKNINIQIRQGFKNFGEVWCDEAEGRVLYVKWIRTHQIQKWFKHLFFFFSFFLFPGIRTSSICKLESLNLINKVPTESGSHGTYIRW